MLKFKMGWIQVRGLHTDVVLSSRIRLARNFSQRPFPHNGAVKTLKATLEASFEAAKKTAGLAAAAYLKLEEMEDLDRQFLIERHLISPEMAKNYSSRGGVVGDKEMLSLRINEEDHLRLQGLEPGLSLSSLWKALNTLEEELARTLPLAFDEKWGYLTACPTNAGTGLRASCLVHLPALSATRQTAKLLEELSRIGLVVRGFYGEGTQPYGDFFQISNAISLGPKEEDIIDNIQRVLKSLVDHEKESRMILARPPHKSKLEDRVYRSLGILSQARSISFEETMQHLSRLRLGVSLGWEMPVDLHQINELLILSQPAHIQMIEGSELDAGARDLVRATLIRKKLER
ncbi:MAG: protein arginine kinase [Elusimicrobia bacterium]|nr:protein arginine kinase [Elusimicrobiota bacterium]